MRDHNTQSNRPTTSRRRRPGRTLRKVVAATAALVVVGGTVAGLSAWGGGSTGQREQTLDTYVVSLTNFDVTTTSSGELEAKNQIEVRSELEIASTIVEVIEEGKVVKKGDVLVRLNSDQVQTQITDVSLRVETSAAELEKAETAVMIQQKENASKISQARLKVLLAELAYKQWDEGEKVQLTRDHDQAITKATEEKERLGEKYDKCIELEKKGYVSTDQMKRDKLEYDDAVRALEKAELAKSIFEKYEIPSSLATKQSDVQQAKEELERVEEQTKIELKSKEAEQVTAKRKLDTNTEHLTKLQRQLEKSTIVAPADGLVVYATSMERSRRGWGDDGPLAIGRQVFPNEALIILPDTSVMVATVRVHETLASRIREGLPATVKVDAVGGRVFNASVLSIGILAEASGWRDPNLREYTVKLALKSAESIELKPSMRCEAEIIMGNVDDALAIPVQSVHNDGMLRYVLVQSESGSKFVRRPVKLGRISESLGEVVAGLQKGERVLLRKAAAGEVLDRQFTSDELTAVGLKRSAEGDLVRIDGGQDGGGRGGRRADGARTARVTSPTAAAGAPATPSTDQAASTTESAAAVKPADAGVPEAATTTTPTTVAEPASGSVSVAPAPVVPAAITPKN